MTPGARIDTLASNGLVTLAGWLRWAAPPALPVQARLDDEDIDTTIDSEVARYYLERYLQGARTRPDLDPLIDELERGTAPGLPSRDQIQDLTQRFSLDFAAVYLFRRIQLDPANRRLQERFRAELASTLAGAGERSVALRYRGYVTLFVPGLLYRADPDSGADFHRPRELLDAMGLEQQLVPIDQVGPVEDNARIIADHVDRHTHLGKKVVLVSASSAGPAVALTLATGVSQHAVRAWVNIGGILHGSWRADDAFRWPKRWLVRALFAWKGWERFEAGRGYCTAVSAKRFARLRLPPQVLIVNYVGVPLSGQVSRRARRGYRILRRHGPNDGLTPILDAIVPGSLTIADFGLDHYYLHPQIDARTVSLARTVLGYAEESASR